MKIKRFKAPDMRQAIKMVREEHGADAVILSNRKVGDGIEIISAIDYDENYIESMLEQNGAESSPPQSQSPQAQPQPPSHPQPYSQPSHDVTPPPAGHSVPPTAAFGDVRSTGTGGLPDTDPAQMLMEHARQVQSRLPAAHAYRSDSLSATPGRTGGDQQDSFPAHPAPAGQGFMNQGRPAAYPAPPVGGQPPVQAPQHRGAQTHGLYAGEPTAPDPTIPEPTAQVSAAQASAELNEVDDFSFVPPASAPTTPASAQALSGQGTHASQPDLAHTAAHKPVADRAAMNNPMLAAAYSQIQQGAAAPAHGRELGDDDAEDRVSISSRPPASAAVGDVESAGLSAEATGTATERKVEAEHRGYSADNGKDDDRTSSSESPAVKNAAGDEEAGQDRADAPSGGRGQQPPAEAAESEARPPQYRSERDLEVLAMQRELDTLKSLLNSQINQPNHMGIPHVHPAHTGIYARLEELGVRTDLANEVLAQLPLSSEVNEGWRKALAVLAHKLTIAEDDIIETGGIVALLGPTGVGKTTTIAKLAARYALKHGRDKVALISMDNYRVAAHEQICSYGKMIGAPVYMPSTLAEFNTTLGDLYDKPLVLIDTPGVSQRDKRIKEQHEIIQNTSYGVQSYLTVSANTQVQALNQIARAYSGIELSGCVITKIDEAASLGGMLSVLIKWALPVAYISEGQRVPDDLMRARPYSLVSKAVTMMQQTELLSSSGAAINSKEDSYNAHAG